MSFFSISLRAAIPTLLSRSPFAPIMIAFWIFFIVLKEIGAARASLVVYPNTAVAVVLGIFLLDEQLTLAIAIGLPMVLLGSYFASRKPSAPVIAG